MKRTTECTTERATEFAAQYATERDAIRASKRVKNHLSPSTILVMVALLLALVPGTALATSGVYAPAAGDISARSPFVTYDAKAAKQGSASVCSAVLETARSKVDEVAEAARAARVDKVLAYDRAAIDAIGTQASTGHSICCPSFSCAYADAVMDGTVRAHTYYGCGCCVWTDWGGGNSSFRSLGTSEQLLREAYDQIAAGKPTVVHVSASYGEHWIALIGYQGVDDPDHLTLANFVALDPWDGVQLTASDRFALYGDACEHISSR